MTKDWIFALVGGVLIGLSVSLMLLLNGRVTGISGIINGVLKPQKNDTLWRVLFIIGLVLGGFFAKIFSSEVFLNTLNVNSTLVVVAGLLVGFGTVMGSGCTSGHGVCGISRLSPRSVIATIFFIGAGVVTVFMLRTMSVVP